MNLHLHLMEMLAGGLLRGAARLAAGALIAGLWQGMLLCAATGAVLQAVPAATARLRFLVWGAVFCVSVAMPFVDLAAGVSAGQAGISAGPHWVVDARWSYLLAAVWMLAAAYRVGELLLQALGLRALWRSAVPVPDEALAGTDAALAVGGRSVVVCTSGDVDRPSVIGFFAPRILVPEWLFAELTATELRHIVLHEMEHLRRRDDWMNLAQKIGLALLPLNPALFWIDRRLSTERELACDDGVLERTRTPRAYAASLASVAERRLEVRRPSRMGALALAATGLRRRSELGQRIESILGQRAPGNRAFAGGLAAVLVAAVVGSAAWLARIPQLVAFGSGVPARQLSGPDVAIALRDTVVPPSPAIARGATVPFAGLQNVSFHQPVRNNAVAKATAVRAKAAARRLARIASAPRPAGTAGFAPAMDAPPPFVVLTSWEGTPVSRVVIAMPDGRFLVAPYAAVPTQAGWLLVQL